jgi:PAS domain S-box-containing protein
MKHDHHGESPSLRVQAEQRLDSVGNVVGQGINGKDPLALIHELQVHQIELEMQNDELRSAQHQLEKEHQRYLELYEFTPAGCLTLDEKGTIKEMNLTAATILGRERSFLVKRPFARLLSPDSRTVFEQFYWRIFTGRNRENCEVMLDDGRNRRTCLLAEGIADVSEDGRVQECRVVLSDITGIKRAEGKLRESEEQLRLFIEYAPAALAMFDTDMRYLSMSRRWRNDYGLGERELLGVSHYKVFPEISAEWREAHRRGLTGEVLRAEGDRFERADGSVQWVRWEIRPWYETGGNIGGIVIFAEDITDIKQAEEVLRRYELLAHNSRDIILIVRRDGGRILEANAAAVKTYGYNQDELLGLTVKELRAPESVVMADSQMAEADAHGILFETVHRRKDGSTFPVEISSQGATINGTRTLISVIRDISERKQAEKLIQQHLEELRASNEDLVRFNDVAVGRELRMIELKKEINELCDKAGLPQRYEMDCEEL